MVHVNKNNSLKVVLIYVANIITIYLFNILLIKLIKIGHLDDTYNIAFAVIWFIIIACIYIASYKIITKVKKSNVNTYLYFLPYIIMNILLTALYYFHINYGIDNYITYYIDIWFCFTNTIAWFFADGLNVLIYQALIYSLWIIIIAFLSNFTNVRGK